MMASANRFKQAYDEATQRLKEISQKIDEYKSTHDDWKPENRRYRSQGRWLYKPYPQELEDLERQAKSWNERQNQMSRAYSEAERTQAMKEERKESIQDLREKRQEAARAGEGSAEEKQYLRARQEHKKEFGSVPEFTPIKFTGASQLDQGERILGVSEGVQHDIPAGSKYSPGFLRQLGVEPQGPREDFLMERQQRERSIFERQKAEFARERADYFKEDLFQRQKDLKMEKGAEIMKGLQAMNIDQYLLKQPGSAKEYPGFETRVMRLQEWETNINTRAARGRSSLGLGFLNVRGDESFLGKVGKGFGNVAYYASGLGMAEFGERVSLSFGKLYATGEGLIRTPRLTERELLRAGRETSKIYDIRTPEGVVTWGTALVAPLGPMFMQRYSKAGQARAVMRTVSKRPTDVRIVRYYGLKKSSVNVRSELKASSPKASLSKPGPVTQQYRLLTPTPGPAVVSGKNFYGVMSAKGTLYATRTVTMRGNQYFVRTVTTPKGVTTAKVFRGDQLLGTFKGKGSPGLAFTEPRSLIKQKEFISMDEFRAERLMAQKSTYGVLTRSVKQKYFKYSEYYPSGRGVIGSREKLVVRTTKLGREVQLSKPWIVDYDKGTIKPSGVTMTISRTRYKFVEGLRKPKAVIFRQDEAGIFVKKPAVSRTTQQGMVRGVYNIRYQRLDPGAFGTLRDFGEVTSAMMRSKKGTFYGTRGFKRTSQDIQVPQSIISRAKSSLTFFDPIVKGIPKTSLKMFPMIMTRQSSRSRISPDMRIFPEFKTEPITRQIPKLISVPKISQQPIMDIPTRQVTQPILRIKTTQRQTPASRLITIQTPALTGTPFTPTTSSPPFEPPRTTTGTPPTVPSLFMPSIEPGKKKSSTMFRIETVFNPKYFASVEASLFDIRGKKPSSRAISTGLGLRPIAMGG